MKLNALKLGYAGAIVSAAVMLLTGILGNLGIYTSAATQMMKWHMYFNLSAGGIITGMIEAAIISFVAFYALVVVYNWLLSKQK